MLEHIGKITILFSYLDMEMNVAIWALIGAGNSVGRLITGSLTNFSSRLAMFENLAFLRRPANAGRTRELAKHLEYAAGDRNRLIHDELYEGNATAPLMRVRRISPRKATPQSYDATFLHLTIYAPG